MARTAIAILAGVAAAMLGACYSPSVASCLYACDNGACPADLSCNADHMCSEHGTACGEVGGDASGDGRGDDGGGDDGSTDNPPHVSITAPTSDGMFLGPLTTVAWSTDKPGTNRCDVNGKSTDCPGSAWTHSLAEGDYEFAITIADAHGLLSVPATRTFHVVCEGGAPPLNAYGAFHFETTNQYANSAPNHSTSVAYGGTTADHDTGEPVSITGRFGRGIRFNAGDKSFAHWGAQYGSIIPFTVELWYRPLSNTHATYQPILRDSNGQLTIQQLPLSSTLQVQLYDPGSGARPTITAPLELNAWNLIDVTYTGDVLQVYVNGRPQANPAVQTGIDLIDFTSIDLGYDIVNGLDADIDELVVAPTALDDTRVLARYCPLTSSF